MSLAKEALSSGDRTLSENYFQHADHFMRIIDEKKINQNKIHDIRDEIKTPNVISGDNTSTTQEQSLNDTKEKKE